MSLYNRLIFGSMRMNQYNYSVKYWIDLFNYMYENGISTHHVSYEYDSYLLYLTIYKKFQTIYPEKKLNHLVKLAEPHFDSEVFKPELMRQKVDDYLNDLNSEKLWGIQWMWRGNLEDDNSRLEAFEQNYSIFSSTLHELKKEGKFQKLFLFPYTKLFCEFVIQICHQNQTEIFDGLTVYRNIEEKDYDQYFKYFNNNIIIRPLNAGKFVGNINKKKAIIYALNHINISAAIISISAVDRLKEIT